DDADDADARKPTHSTRSELGARECLRYGDSSRMPRTVTDPSARDRVRRWRERKKAEAEAAAPLLYERDDWTLFMSPETLPQKAGCEPDKIGAVVLKELVDNALDAGATARIKGRPCSYRVEDDGPGIDPADIPRIFAVNRPLLSSKLKR